MKKILLPLLLLLSSSLIGQNLSGKWTGNLKQGKNIYQLEFNLQMTENGHYKGESYVKKDNKYGTLKFSGYFKGNSFFFVDKAILTKKSNTNTWCLKQGTLRYSIVNDVPTLTGEWSARLCKPGTISLQKLVTNQPDNHSENESIIESKEIDSLQLQTILRRAVVIQDSGDFYNSVGEVLLARKMLYKAYKLYNEVENIPDSLLLKYSTCLNLLGALEKNSGYYRSANQKLTDALEIQKKIVEKDSSKNIHYGATLINLGHLQYLRRYFYDAEGTLLLAEKVLSRFEGETPIYPEVFDFLGLVYMETKKHDKAISSYEKAIEKYNSIEHLSQESGFEIPKIERRIGMAFYFKEEYVKSKKYLEKSVNSYRDLAEKIPGFTFESELVRSLMLLGELNIKKFDERQIGIDQLDEALKIGSKYYFKSDKLFQEYILTIRRIIKKYS